METKLNLLLRAICAYEKNGVANFSLKCLDFFGHENTIRKNIQKLEIEGYIVKTNMNGLYSKYIINKILDCPKFIFNDKFSLTYKCILLELYELNKELTDPLTASYIDKHIKTSYNTIKKYVSDSTRNDLL